MSEQDEEKKVETSKTKNRNEKKRSGREQDKESRKK